MMPVHPCDNAELSAPAHARVRVQGAPPSAPTQSAGDWWLRGGLVLIFALYVRVVGFARVYDDNFISPWTAGWRDLPKFFTHDIFGSNSGAHSVYYRPMAMSWGLVVGSFTGGAPGWCHLAAILLHIAVVLLAFVFGRHLFRDERLALLAAVLFGLHPSKVESVAWIGSSNVDGLSGVFFFATLIAFLRWRESSSPPPRRLWAAASAALFACAMFTKETMVCIPVLLAAHLWLFPSAVTEPPAAAAKSADSLARRLADTVRTLLPYGAVLTVYLAARNQVIKPAPASASYVHPTFTLSNLWTAPYSIWWYLRHLAMPWGLSVEYAPRIIEHPTLRTFFLPAAGLALLLAVSWWLWRRQRSAVAAFLGIWFVVNLVPPVIVSPMVSEHDRYLYLPAYAFCALVAWAILRLGDLPASARVAMALCVVALWSGLTWHEMGYWDNDAKLWGRAYQISPSSLLAEVEMAYIDNGIGETTRALAVLNDGLRYHPESPSLWLTRAGILAGAQQTDQAREAYLKVLQVTDPPPGQSVPPGARANIRAAAACKLAKMAIAAGQYGEGEHYARMALGLRFDGVGFHAVLGQSLRGEGHVAQAQREDTIELRMRIAQQRRNQDH